MEDFRRCFYVGVNDTTLDLFESQYRIPDGVTYNSYVIKDSKIAVMDTVDNRATDAWFDNLEEAFGGKVPDYLVVSHLEPDHAGNIRKFLVKYPETVVVANAKTVAMLPQFFELDTEELSILEVKEGDTLKLGRHTLHFVMAPMVHWPEVMVEYDEADKILFSADGFGRFGALSQSCTYDAAGKAQDVLEHEWTGEARRYFINIVGKYGANVQGLLKKAAVLDIEKLHRCTDRCLPVVWNTFWINTQNGAVISRKKRASWWHIHQFTAIQNMWLNILLLY